MNKPTIRNFAIWARNKLIADIQYKAGLMGITSEGIKNPLPQSTSETQFFDIGTAEPYAISGEEIKQRTSLVNIIEQKERETDYSTAYKYIVENVAYTWFNRLIAIRFMEVNDYLPSHVRILSSESGKMEPDIVTNPFDADLEYTEVEKQDIIRLKNDNLLDECFRLLFIKQCNALNDLLPELFEKTSDYTEILLNVSAIDKEGVVYHLVNDIPEDDFNIEKGGQVEILGWMYQYYNTEPKNAAFAKDEKITKEEIPAVTQLFTPDWIVRYMVENSLGRLWLEGHPNSHLQGNWKYYLEEAEQEPDVQSILEGLRNEYSELNPQDIRFIDPCMGSGHILVYAFDILMQIYESAGYSQRDAAKSIIENNIYGLDIDDRAYQMAYFAVMMKGRQYNRRILSSDTICHVYSIQDSNSINRNQLKYFGAGLNEIEKNDALTQITGLLDAFKDAKEYGSILDIDNYNWDLLLRFASNIEIDGQMTIDAVGITSTLEKLKRIVNIGKTMSQKYEVVSTNPPYMALSGASAKLNTLVSEKYNDEKADLYTVFINKCQKMTRLHYYQSMITQHGWMFQTTFEEMRKKQLANDVVNMAHLGARAFDEISGEVVQTSAFVFRKTDNSDYYGVYCRLVDGINEADKETMFLRGDNRFKCKKSDFIQMPKNVMVYWVSDSIKALMNYPELVKNTTFKEGITTANNDLFLRLWQEVDYTRLRFQPPYDDNDIWVPYNKGGTYRKWYGNNSYVVNWSFNGRKIKEYPGSSFRNADYQLQEGGTYSALSNNFAVRYTPAGFAFDSKGTMFFSKKLKPIMAYLNSKIFTMLVSCVCPTLDFRFGTIQLLPDLALEIDIDKNINLCKEDWDSSEMSWDFKRHPLVNGITKGHSIEEKFLEWSDTCEKRFSQLKESEEAINRKFIEKYSLESEILPEVDDKDISVNRANLKNDIKTLISYAVGCIFGRYSLDEDGIAYAGGDWDSTKYNSYTPDADNIVPITDEEYLGDDIVAIFCAWLKKVYGEETLEQNLDYIAKALEKKGNTSRDIIRNYFINDFYKDHCQMYSVSGSGKRPIYWLFDSGKQNGFKALIYIHRYNADTIGNLRVDYLHKMQRVYESEIERMQDIINHSTNSREVGVATKRKEKLQKQLKECHEYDEKIGHLALARTEINLNNGVRYNYRKIQMGTDEKLYEVLADSKAIMLDVKKYKTIK